jgi:hypothetical protein
LGVLQLERERGPGVLGERRDDEWGQIRLDLGVKAGVFHPAAQHNSLSASWSFLPQGQNCDKVVEERPHIQLIAWPGNSVDLNPIENIWSWMKGQLYQNTTATNMEDWKEEIKKLWAIKVADSDYLKKLVESMPRRLQDVIERGGA